MSVTLPGPSPSLVNLNVKDDKSSTGFRRDQIQDKKAETKA
jgi:hypothetical protein